MPYYKTCPYCGDNLDPGERCDCRDKGKEAEQPKATDKKGEAKSA